MSLQYRELQIFGDKTSFIFDRAKIVGTTLQPQVELIVEAFFKPQTTGYHKYTFEYKTNVDAIDAVETTLQDEHGKEVRSIEIKNQTESLKISTKDLPVGVYVLRMFVGEEVVDKKFGVMR